uniref:helix-turn-helix domain-containing protein n=1 Tax=Eubacterium sp. TaxID=142586 RepID=UPI004028C853
MEQEKKEIQLHIEELKRYGNLFDISERKELIGEMLRALRQGSGLTQSQVADLIGIKPVTYSTYENGTRETPAEILIRLSILFGVPTDIILQKERLSKDSYIAQNQIDAFNDELQELKDIITDPESELNPQFVDMMKAMTDAFSKMNEQLTEFNNNNKEN